MNNELLNIFMEFHEKSPLVATDSNGYLTWLNISFKTAFPAIFSTGNNSIYNNFAIVFEDGTEKVYSDITSRLFKCTSLFSGNKEVYSGIAISGGGETLFCFNTGLIDETDIIERISVVNMELAALSRELAKKKKEIEEANQRANNLLRTDFLTGCGNRRYFYERLEEFCSRFIRNRSNTFCVVFADLNKFKEINDKFGHDIGDQALILFSESMRKVIRKEDVFARIGGDEFAMIIECGNEKDCSHFIEKLRMTTSTIKLPGTEHVISSSFGFVFSEGFVEPAKIMKDADEMLYADKNRINS
ncbi:MAG: GGDEF domain-containing protein [Clostridia bacterium]|nr:GGDEF domain-containing protein [Clostridia bacterium]